MTMDTKDNKNIQNGTSLSDKEVLDILSQASSQYEKYLEIAALEQEEKKDIVNSIKRDINHPLNLVLK